MIGPFFWLLALVLGLHHTAVLRRVRMYHWTRPYRRQNSTRGIGDAKRGRYPWMDLDAQQSRDGRWECIHWGKPGKERFRYPSRAVCRRVGIPTWKAGRLVGVPTTRLTHRQIATLRSRDGYIIRGIGDMLMLAAASGINVEVEPKFTPTPAQFANLAIAAERAYGPRWQRHVIVKRLATIGGWGTTLSRAKAAGFTTCVLRHSGRGLPDFIDQYRP